MTINGVEVDFDMDRIVDYEKFVAAYQTMEQRNKKVAFSLDSMTDFMRQCLPKAAVTTLLEDGRISTLTKVFVDFMSQGVEQITEKVAVFQEAKKTVVNMNLKAQQFDRDIAMPNFAVLNGGGANASPSASAEAADAVSD